MAVDDLELAGSLVREAGGLAARMLAAGLETHHKTSISDVVSDADHAAEKLITERLIAERPSDGLIGEEGARRDGERTWYIDPVDGTYNFLAKLPIWCSAVGLAQGDRPLLGAVYQPSADELWLGGTDRPTTLNGAPVPQLAERPLGEVAIASYLHPARMDDDRRLPMLAVVSKAATVRILGSGSVELSAVAGGRLGGFVQANSLPWDWIPGAALVRAAGGTAEIVEHRGQRWCVAGNKRSAGEIIQALLAS